MTSSTPDPTQSSIRPALDRARIVQVARNLADRDGITKLTMRSLADELSVTPMSMYRYISNKEELLDALVDSVFTEIASPLPDGDWMDELHRFASSSRDILRRHGWALSLIETRTMPGRAMLVNRNAVLGSLRGAGFSVANAAQAFSTLDAYVYGFVLQEISLPIAGGPESEDVAAEVLASIPMDEFPHIIEVAM